MTYNTVIQYLYISQNDHNKSSFKEVPVTLLVKPVFW